MSSMFGPARSALIPAQLTELVTDPDLAAAQSALVTAFQQAVAPKALQSAVDAAVAALLAALAPKATQASIDALGTALTMLS